MTISILILTLILLSLSAYQLYIQHKQLLVIKETTHLMDLLFSQSKQAEVIPFKGKVVRRTDDVLYQEELNRPKAS